MFTLSLDLELNLATLHSKSTKLKTLNFKTAEENFIKFVELSEKYKIKTTIAAVIALLEEKPFLLKYLDSPYIEIACHSYSHRSFDLLSERRAELELKRCREFAKNTTSILALLCFPAMKSIIFH